MVTYLSGDIFRNFIADDEIIVREGDTATVPTFFDTTFAGFTTSSSGEVTNLGTLNIYGFAYFISGLTNQIDGTVNVGEEGGTNFNRVQIVDTSFNYGQFYVNSLSTSFEIFSDFYNGTSGQFINRGIIGNAGSFETLGSWINEGEFNNAFGGELRFGIAITPSFSVNDGRLYNDGIVSIYGTLLNIGAVYNNLAIDLYPGGQLIAEENSYLENDGRIFGAGTYVDRGGYFTGSGIFAGNDLTFSEGYFEPDGLTVGDQFSPNDNVYLTETSWFEADFSSAAISNGMSLLTVGGEAHIGDGVTFQFSNYAALENGNYQIIDASSIFMSPELGARLSNQVDGFDTSEIDYDLVITGNSLSLSVESLGPLNEPPVAIDDVFVTTEDDTWLSGSVFADNGNGADTDPDGDTLTVISFDPTNVNGGTVILNADGTFSYTQNGQFEYLAEGETATESFSYTITDGLATDTATVTIDIAGVNDAPTVVAPIADQTISTNESFTFDISTYFDDVDTNDTLTYSLEIVNLLTGTLLTEAGIFSQDDAVFGADSITQDTISGLEWLDVPLTLNTSYNEVLSELGTGGAFEGFRVATESEFSALLENAEIIFDSTGFTGYTDNFDEVQTLIGHLGSTQTFNNEPALFGFGDVQTSSVQGSAPRMGMNFVGGINKYIVGTVGGYNGPSVFDTPSSTTGTFLVRGYEFFEGLSFDASTGQFSGSTTSPAYLGITVTATDESGASISDEFELTIAGTANSNGNGDDVIVLEEGTTKANGGNGSDVLIGTEAGDTLRGNGEDDRLIGNGGEDTLFGGAGADTLIGGEGSDILQGGAGTDTFILSVNQGIDTIKDFEQDIDLIQLDDGLTFGIGPEQVSSSFFRGKTELLYNGEVFAELQGKFDLTELDFVSSSV